MTENGQDDNKAEAAAAALRQQRLTKAYGEATKALRDAHRDEFNTLYAAEAKKLGEAWEPKLTDEQKAEAQIAELVAKFPKLAQSVVPPEATP